MILITGGLGFIGSHTTRALVKRGESCVLVQRRSATLPDSLAAEAGAQIFVEQGDIADSATLSAIGERHHITGIVHLAGSMPWPPGADEPIDGARRAVQSLLNVVQAARDWGVLRVSVASTIGVYGGAIAASPLREDLPLPMTAGHVIPAFKKIGELLVDHLADVTDVPIVNLRIAGVWGPLGHPKSVIFPAPHLVHAAARGTAPDLSTLMMPAYADNGSDLCYVTDCADAIARLQLAATVNHRTYNVGSGRLTTNRELVAALKTVVPDCRIDLPDGRDPYGPPDDIYLDITRLEQDTGYRPAYDTETAVADYVNWLRAGNDR